MKASRIVLVCALAFLFLYFSLSCADRNGMNNSSETLSAMKGLYRQSTDSARRNNFQASDSLGSALYHLAQLEDNDEYIILGLLCMSYSRREASDINERFRYLLEAEKLLDRIDNDSVEALLYHFMGVCSADDFEKSKTYFSKSLHAARQAGYVNMQMMAECNLAEIFRTSGDTLGIRYDLEIHDFAVKTGNEVMRHAAAVRCAEYYMRNKSTLSKSLPYLDEINNSEDHQFDYHNLKSKWYLMCDSIPEAMREWHRAEATNIASPGFLMTGGRLFQLYGDFRKSYTLLQSADSAYPIIDPGNVDRIEIYRLQSKNLQHLGEPEEALVMLERYAAARDSLRESVSRREINAFKIKFETEKKEMVIAQQNITLKSRTILLAMSGIFIVVITVGFMLFIRKRNRLYRSIVEQNKEFVTRQDEYVPFMIQEKKTDRDDMAEPKDAVCAECSDKTENKAENKIESVTGMPVSGKANSIWRDILMEMEQNRIYADPNITRDIFAERVHTNHTWLTAVIKSRTGKSYTQFMNSWRINEAVRILAEVNCRFNNKELAEYLGFLTPQTFYAAFRAQTGMSPSRFRQNILESSKSEAKTEE